MMMDDLLHYRRQFLLSNEVITGLGNWQHWQVADVHLFAHPDLEITVEQTPSAFVFLIGYLFDPVCPKSTNEQIVPDILSTAGNFRDLIAAVKRYAGRYALIYRDETDFAILHDPLGLREIYYCTVPNRVICGSQPNLLDAFSEPRLGITQDQDILHFHKNDLKLVRSGRLWVGEETYFRDVKHLMPNRYLDIASLTARRYWPNRKLERMDLQLAARQACAYLRGVLEAVTSRFEVMMAVTSGFDSRSLLAASREVGHRIYYFINKKPPLDDSSADIRIPRSIFDRLGIPFHVHDAGGPVDEEFREIFLKNVFMSTDRLLPAIYNVYYKNHQNKVNLLGVGEIGREYYGTAPPDLDGYYLAYCLKYRRSRYATAQCEKWLGEAREVAEKYNVDVMRLFLWEGLLGNWGVVGNSESDIAIEEFDPYDSHHIYEIMLSADQDQGDLFEEMFKQMWPELLEYPFNPPETLQDKAKNLLDRMGLYKFLKKQRYRWDRRKFQRLGGVYFGL